MSFFDSVTPCFDDPIMVLPAAFAKDPRAFKINLGIGAYQDSSGKPVFLSCVKEAEKQLFSKEQDKEYLPIPGDSQYISLSSELIFGSDLIKKLAGHLYTAQSVGGTSALRIGADFLSQEISRIVYLPTPTWQNHTAIFKRSGMGVRNYRYYDPVNFSLDMDGLLEDIGRMPEKAIIVLHAICHNPSGIDPTPQQWQEISACIKKQKIVPFLDIAYQGFAEGPEKDAESIRYFANEGHEMLVANSFSKNFGLYCERAGTISVIAHEKSALLRVESQIRQIIRSSYSNPPRHGAKVIAMILQDPVLKMGWEKELSEMRSRIQKMRKGLIGLLQDKMPGRFFDFLRNQQGFFSFLGLTEKQVEKIIAEYAIYMPSNGRINVAGLNESNLEYVASALTEVFQQ